MKPGARKISKAKTALNFKEEIADIAIRLLHLASVMGVDVEKEILKKMEHNKGRHWDWDKLNESHI